MRKILTFHRIELVLRFLSNLFPTMGALMLSASFLQSLPPNFGSKASIFDSAHQFLPLRHQFLTQTHLFLSVSHQFLTLVGIMTI